jgi:hypothetical protein
MLYPLSYWGRHERSGQLRHRVKVTGPDGFTRLGAAVPLTRPARPAPSVPIRVSAQVRLVLPGYGLSRTMLITRSGAAVARGYSRRCRYASSPGGRRSASLIEFIAKRGES